jgi:hypothetical protein
MEHGWIAPPEVSDVATLVAEVFDERTGTQRSFSLIEINSLLVGLEGSTVIRMAPLAASSRVIAQRGRVENAKEDSRIATRRLDCIGRSLREHHQFKRLLEISLSRMRSI